MDTINKERDPKADMRAVVEDGVKAFALAEDRARKAYAATLALHKILDRGNALGMMGALQSMRMEAKARVAAGKIAEAEMMIVELHRECTDIAIGQGVDVPTMESGGGGR